MDHPVRTSAGRRAQGLVGGGQKYGWTAYALFAVEATKRWAGEAITAESVMPGAIRTKLLRYQLEAMIGNLRP
ncbi:hypothetical protein ACIQFZ_35165 [Streptomyces sp. NPDC093064]|uniref:hypothetical protein n=1 Tax=unclassified Streptomyces TaxID=2593676 RepID=UPI00341D6210